MTHASKRARGRVPVVFEIDTPTRMIWGLGVAILCAKVSLLPLVFDPSLDWPFVVSKALLSHALAYVLAGVLVALLVRLGRAFIPFSWLHVPVLAFVLANAAASMFASDSLLALYGTHARMLGLGTIVDWALLYFGIALLVRSRFHVIAVAVSLLGASALVLLYEGIQLVGKDPFDWNVPTTQRPFSSFGQATTLAQYLTTVAFGVLSFGLVARRLHPALRALALLFTGVLLLGAAATGTRSAVLGVLGGSIAVVLLLWFAHPSKKARGVTIVASGLTLAAFTALLVLTPLGARLVATIEPQSSLGDEELITRLEPSTDVRVSLYVIALEMIRERPILGYGPDNFPVGVTRYRSDHESHVLRQSLPSSAHSWIAYVGTGSGLLGLLSFIGIASIAVVLAARHSDRSFALAGAAMIGAFLGTGLTTVNEIGTDWLFWAAAGMVAAATTPAPRRSENSGRPTRAPADLRSAQAYRASSRSVAAIICVVAASLMALTTASAWEASRSNRSAQQFRLVGRVSQAITSALDSTRLDPRRSDYWHGLGLAYIASARWSDAVMALSRASNLAPYDVRKIGDLVRAELLLANTGDNIARARALQLAELAVRTDANNPAAHLTRALAMQVSGNSSEALRSVERALALDPMSTSAPLYVTATQVNLDAGRVRDAIRIASEGVRLIGLSAQSVELRYELARALVANGQDAEALTELDVALGIQPNDRAVMRLRAELAARLQR